MPRRARMYLPGIPVHVVQRGNNREACFFRSTDYARYLHWLGEALDRYRVALHAYVLMTNHVHLCLTPSDEAGISRVMALLGKNYVSYVNRTRGRTGTLWEGRHKASLIQTSRYLLACMRYIEMNPVRARMTRGPGDYRWSSFMANATGVTDARVTPHAEYTALGTSAAARRRAYRALFDVAVPDDEIAELRSALHFNYPLGDERFRARIERRLKSAMGHDRPGRPPTQRSRAHHTGS